MYSTIDLHIQLIGENKIICTDEEYGIGIYAGDSRLNKDLAILGEGSLTIEFPNKGGEAAGISAANLTIESDSTVTASAKNASAIECLGTLEANKGAAISAKSDNNDADIFCSGAVINYGAEINAEIDAIGGVNNRD